MPDIAHMIIINLTVGVGGLESGVPKVTLV